MSRATIERFYTAFAQLDDATMATCYADAATFQDEVFTLNGKRETAGMWSMLCEATRKNGRDAWKLDWRVTGDASAHWDAHYRFSATGRNVLNRIDAAFTFTPQGLIQTHRDRFDFWAWSRQALGAPGLLLGWTPFLRGKVRAQAGANLAKFLKGRP